MGLRGLRKRFLSIIILLMALACVQVAPVHGIIWVVINPSLHQYIDLGQNLPFKSYAGGDHPPFSYQWYQNGSPVGADSSSWNFTASTLGTFGIYLLVRDHTNATFPSAVTLVTINPALKVEISPSAVTMNVNQSVTFIEYATGGTLPYRYTWWVGHTRQAGNSPSFTFTPSSVGDCNITCIVQDGSTTLYVAPRSTASVVVNTQPTSAPPNLSAFINFWRFRWSWSRYLDM